MVSPLSIPFIYKQINIYHQAKIRLIILLYSFIFSTVGGILAAPITTTTTRPADSDTDTEICERWQQTDNETSGLLQDEFDSDQTSLYGLEDDEDAALHLGGDLDLEGFVL